MVGEGARGAAVNYLSICSGIEAASVAWHDLNWHAAGFSEIDPFPCAVLSHRFPATRNFGDMTRHADWNIEPGTVDLVVGGTPCQSFSVAGLRAGMADPRGNLALTFLAIVDRLRPQWVVWENVPGVLSSNGGRDFGAFLGALGKLGYGFAYRVLDAQYFGVAQRRRRVFVVANATDWRRAAAVLFEPESLRGDSAKGGKARKGAPRSVGGGAENGMFWNGDQVTQTLDAVLAKGQTMPDKNRFPAVLVPPSVIGSLCARDYKGVGSQYVNEGKVIVTPTPSVIPIQDGRGVEKKQNGLLTLGGRPDPAKDRRMTIGLGADGDPQFTLQASHSHAVATGYAVRRLTPTECERLQGFPDDWTAIPYRGKPAADGPRYKAIGNSMAVPVMRWIGERIDAVDRATKVQP